MRNNTRRTKITVRDAKYAIEGTQLWANLREHGAAGIEFPVWAYWTCADIFDALGDAENSRAGVEAGYRELMTRADKISSAEWRRSLLDNVTEHRAMVEMWRGSA